MRRDLLFLVTAAALAGLDTPPRKSAPSLACPSDCAHRARCTLKSLIPSPDYSECRPCKPNRGADMHEGAEQTGTETNRQGERVEIHTCRDCGATWEV